MLLKSIPALEPAMVKLKGFANSGFKACPFGNATNLAGRNSGPTAEKSPQYWI